MAMIFFLGAPIALIVLLMLVLVARRSLPRRPRWGDAVPMIDTTRIDTAFGGLAGEQRRPHQRGRGAA